MTQSDTPIGADVPIPWRVRLPMCLALSGFTGFYQFRDLGHGGQSRDFGQVWYAARAVLHGQNPYALIGPGRAFHWASEFFYPLPAALIAVPFAPLSYRWAMTLFVVVGTIALAWALMEHGFPPLLGLFSICFANAVYNAQWSPLFAGAFVLAPLSALWVAKPTVGLALFAARPSRWAIFGGVALIALSFAIQPGWFSAWYTALHDTSLVGGRFPYDAPIMLPGGFIALLALARWRRPEARLLVALACVPQTLLPYEAVYLLLIPRGVWQSLMMVAASYVLTFWWVNFNYADVDLVTYIRIYGAGMVMLLYVPATVMVLLRPNEGELPPWLSRFVPAWRRPSFNE